MSTNEEKYELEVLKKIVDSIEHNMTRREAGRHLAVHHNVNRAFTRIVWDKFAKENEDFMKEYEARMEIRHQVYPEVELSNEQRLSQPFLQLANGSQPQQRSMPRQVFGSNMYQDSDRVISFQPQPSMPRRSDSPQAAPHQDNGLQHDPSGSVSE